ncbi:MAG: PQQ-binding-like beta-propeller repeat protein, partial [Fimbriiglobus sp.]
MHLLVAPPGWFRRHRTPLFAVGIPAALWAAFTAVMNFEVVPEALMPLMMAFQLATLIGILTLGGWFLTFSGYRTSVKLAGVTVVVALIATAVGTIQRVEFDGQMRPIVYSKWAPVPEQMLERHLAASGPAVGGADLTPGPTDSPGFRGPRGDGSAPGVELSADWAAIPPKILWKHPVGDGHAGIAVAGNSLVTLEQRGGDETVTCYDRDTGKERWATAYPARYDNTQPMGGAGPRTTPAVAGGAVFTLGATGELVATDAATGAKRWQVNILTDNGAKPPQWAMSGSPLVVGSVVVVNPGADPDNNTGQAVAAYDRATGKKVWATGKFVAGYASPMLVTLGGKEQVVVFDAGGLGGYDPADGKELWRHPWNSAMGMNSAQPAVVGADTLFVSSEKSNGGALLSVSGTPSEKWHTRALAARYCSPIVHRGHAFGLGDGQLTCVDLATGKRVWKEGNFGNGQILRAGDWLVMTAEKGDVALVAADPTEFREVGRVPVFTDRTWNMPALAGKRLY